MLKNYYTMISDSNRLFISNSWDVHIAWLQYKYYGQKNKSPINYLMELFSLFIVLRMEWKQQFQCIYVKEGKINADFDSK